eukprot:scaffold31893_cov129-Isochrysis_galbana.AAC.2
MQHNMPSALRTTQQHGERSTNTSLRCTLRQPYTAVRLMGLSLKLASYGPPQPTQVLRPIRHRQRLLETCPTPAPRIITWCHSPRAARARPCSASTHGNP